MPQAQSQNSQGTNITTDRDIITNYARKQITASDEELKQIRANSSLPPDAWKSLNNTLYPVFEEELRLFNDLRGMGLVTNESIYDKEVSWTHSVTQGDAEVGMHPETDTPESVASVGQAGAPLPLIMADHSIGFRDEAGDGTFDINELEAEGASRAVAEEAEQMCLTGWDKSIQASDRKMWGLTNHPDVNTGGVTDWTTNPVNAYDDLLKMSRVLKNENDISPGSGYMTYLSTDYADALNEFASTNNTDFIVRDRVEKLNDIGTLRELPALPPKSVLMFAPRRDVVHLAIAREESTVQWDSPFRTNFKHMMCFAICVKSTMKGQSGVAFFTA